MHSYVLFSNTRYLFVQETSLLLGNLVDVLDEIKFAKMKLLNLTSAAFVLESQTGLFSIPYIQCLQFTSVLCNTHIIKVHIHNNRENGCKHYFYCFQFNAWGCYLLRFLRGG
jgi:hypothetical protein